MKTFIVMFRQCKYQDRIDYDHVSKRLLFIAAIRSKTKEFGKPIPYDRSAYSIFLENRKQS